MVFQSYALYPHMTVKDNLAFGLRRRSLPADEIEQRVQRVAEKLGLALLLARKPHALSGGQRQRVALGRAIVRNPKVFLFDEPLSNLDAALRVTTRNELIKQQHELGTTTIYVTHDQVEAMTMGDRICIMNKGEVVQIGRPLDVYRAPADVFVARFLGNPAMNMMSARIETAGPDMRLHAGGAAFAVDGYGGARLAANGGGVTLGIRPEDIYEAPPVAGEPGRFQEIRARVLTVESLGAETLLLLSLERRRGGDGPRRPRHRAAVRRRRHLLDRHISHSPVRRGDQQGHPEGSAVMTSATAGIIDCHLHVIDPVRFPITPGIGYTPRPDEAAPREALAAVHDRHGVTHAVLVQPSCYGYDNGAMLDAVSAGPGRFKAIAVIENDAPDRVLDALGERGVVGVRYNLATFDPDALTGPGAARQLARLKERGWFVQVHARDDQWASVAPALAGSGAHVLIDHFGIGDPALGLGAPGFRAVLDLGRTGRATLKLSAPFRIASSQDHYAAIEAHVRALLGVFGAERCLWGSDWPFLALPPGIDYGAALAALERWFPDAGSRTQILHHNPTTLFGF